MKRDDARVREALEFLWNIPLRYDDVAYHKAGGGHARNPLLKWDESGPGVASVRLRGKPANHVTSKGRRSTPLFRNVILSQRVADGRLYFSSQHAYPSSVSSIIRYNADDETRKPTGIGLLEVENQQSSVPEWMRWKGTSYATLLTPLGRNMLPGPPEHSSVDLYDPTYLDDPSIELDKQRNTMVRDGYAVSVFLYRPEKVMNKDLNERFRERHPWLDPSLTLSKIRSLKKTAASIWLRLDLELSTVAYAITFFEKLVMMRRVVKDNRRLAMAVCLTLACKYTEPRIYEAKELRRRIFAEFSKEWGIPRKLVLKHEFDVFVLLGFSLHLPISDTSPHLVRMLKDHSIDEAQFLRERIGSIP